MSDLVGAGSEAFRKDGRKDNGDWEVGAPGLRGKGWQDIRGLLGEGVRKRRGDDGKGDTEVSSKKRRLSDSDISADAAGIPFPSTTTNNKRMKPDVVSATSVESTKADPPSATSTIHDEPTEPNQPPQIFKGLTMYLNGSTMPLVSDHHLKQLFARHGGNSSISLGRRTITHVILGERCGGGLASGKIQKENTTIRGKGIKYVSAKWVLDSVEKGIRQPEHRYAAAEIKGKLGGSGQKSVAGLFRAKSA